jgi:hypothetical protein
MQAQVNPAALVKADALLLEEGALQWALSARTLSAD